MALQNNTANNETALLKHRSCHMELVNREISMDNAFLFTCYRQSFTMLFFFFRNFFNLFFPGAGCFPIDKERQSNSSAVSWL